MTTITDTHIRWMIRRDLQEVLDIESVSFECPWLEEEFIQSLRQRNCTGRVAEFDNKVVGYMIYELSAKSIHILNFAVAPEYRLNGIGSQMISSLKDKLHSGRRTRIFTEINEKNLAGQMFFKYNGFNAVAILSEFYDDVCDAYVMEYKI